MSRNASRRLIVGSLLIFLFATFSWARDACAANAVESFAQANIDESHAILNDGASNESQRQAHNAVESFVQANIDKSYAILNDVASSESQRQAQFRSLLSSFVDVRRVALFTLGPYVRSASATEIDAFVAAFMDFLTAVYRRGLDRYKKQKLTVTGSTERSHNDVIVYVRVSGQDEDPSQLQLAFRVRVAEDGRTLITDLQIEGVWLALTQRDDFMGYLQQHEGNIATLSSEVQKRAGQIHVRPTRSEDGP
jgi:phospholipid transport system substrate-binding protein